MKVYLINLDKDKERLDAVDAQLTRLGVTYERIPAVYAKEMNPSEKEAKINRFRWWCAIGRDAVDGEIGCALSHFNFYERVEDGSKKGEGEIACVLEDDVILDERFPMVLEYLNSWMDNKSPKVVLLSNHSQKKDLGDSHSGYLSGKDAPIRIEKIFNDCFTEGYVINLSAIHNIKKLNYPLITPCDSWTRWLKLGQIELFHAFPTVCSQNKAGFVSEIEPALKATMQKKTFANKIINKILRGVGKILDKCLQVITGR